MTLTAHPSHDRLLAYADGSASAGLAMLVASHLTYCPDCRATVERFELVGGALFAEDPPAAVAPPDRARTLERLNEPVRAEPDAQRDPVLPAPLRALLGCGVEAVRWRLLMPGLHAHRIEGFAGEDVSLMRARPGTRVLAHTHDGEETTLVLRGAVKDGDRVYTRGEVSECDGSDTHRPEIVGDEPCVCLVVLSGPMRFTGPLGRALNLLAR